MPVHTQYWAVGELPLTLQAEEDAPNYMGCWSFATQHGCKEGYTTGEVRELFARYAHILPR